MKPTKQRRQKPSAYLDTSLISAYWYQGKDPLALARRLTTREWWDLESRHFLIWASDLTELELRSGSYPRQDRCVRMVRTLPYLPITRPTRLLVEELVESAIVPDTKRFDAFQLAIAVVHQIDYLLSWNYAHLVNPATQERLAVVCARRELSVPMLVSPETIPQVRFGQHLRRRKHD